MSESGNTKLSSVPPAVHWCFTWNNPPDDGFEQLLELFENYASQWVFQEEVGEEGTPHYQGYVRFRVKCRAISKINIPVIHWEKARSVAHAIEYCSDSMKRNGRIWANGINVRRPIKCITNLYPWQKDLVEKIKCEPDDRTLIWVYDESGCSGKSQLAKYLVIKHGAIVTGGRATDIKYQIYDAINKGQEIKIVIWDLSRTVENHISYEGIEKIKDGMFASSKYESGMCVFNSPHVVVFANFEPNYEAMTKDRWEVITL